MTFPKDFLDLLKDDSKALLYLATIMPDGSPQVTPVWCDTDGEHILVNTNDRKFREQYATASLQRETKTEQLFKRLGVDSVKILSGTSYISPLIKFFRLRESRL